MNVLIDEVAKQAFALCDKYDIKAPSHREMFVCGYRYGLRANPWHKVSEELPEENTHILIARKKRNGDYAIEAVWYPEPNITNDIDYWMPVPEIKEN